MYADQRDQPSRKQQRYAQAWARGMSPDRERGHGRPGDHLHDHDHEHDHDHGHDHDHDRAPRRGGPRGPRGAEAMGSFFGRGPRAGRGDIRFAIITLLAEEPMHGYQIIQELSRRSGGVWRASPGSVYPTLQLLEEEGLVRSEETGGKRVFSLTDEGQAALTRRPPGRRAPWDEVGDDVDLSLVELKALTGQVAEAVRQVAQAGTPGQVAAAKALLTETRRSVYRILADESPA